ncbi:PAS domain-containing sensor histidine kinase [Taibaiella koreensis]|uniref:PAS domain-containing sensor histidine kinase n=1 Tax=Taibaiella koreensis TaxID=1268548 RepID=UPI000E59B135|nr:PAS domain S-box protein [Taibaiella koreensis]
MSVTPSFDLASASEKNDIHFGKLVNGLPVPIFTCDKNNILTFYNIAAAELWGYQPRIGEDTWHGRWQLFHPDGKIMQPKDSPVMKALMEAEPQPAELIVKDEDGEVRHLQVYPALIPGAENRMTAACFTLIDISRQKSWEEKQAVLSAIVESSDDAIISKNLDGIITSWNQGAQKIFGYKEDEVLGKHITILIPPSLQAEEERIISNIRAGNKIDHFQTIRLHKDGHEIPISITVSPVKDPSGKITGASKIARDISERIHATRVIEQVAHRLELLYDISKTISEDLDVQAILQKATDATTHLTGAAFGAFFYNTIDEQGEAFMLYTLSGADRSAFEQFGMPRNTAVFHPTFSGLGVVRSDDITKDPRYGKSAPHYGQPQGHLPVVSYLAVPVISVSGEVIGGLFFGHPEPGMFSEEHEDIVSSIAAQAATALDNSRLFEEVKSVSAKKDEFIALASHELKTPLTSIKGYLQILNKTAQDGVGRLFFDKLINQVEKLNSLVTDLFDVSKIEAGKLQFSLEVFNLRQLLQENLETFQYTIQSHRIICEDPGDAIWINADKQRIEQVIVNLVTNAIKYSPQADKIYVNLYAQDGKACLAIKDEGIGLSKEQRQKIFTRFYRAEGTNDIPGLGLGLYLSKEIVDRHEGALTVSSTPGHGSVFLVKLPLAVLPGYRSECDSGLNDG